MKYSRIDGLANTVVKRVYRDNCAIALGWLLARYPAAARGRWGYGSCVIALGWLLAFASGSLGTGLVQAAESELLGTWTVNIEHTQQVQPDNANVRWWEGLQGNFSTGVTVSGVPVPVGGGAKPEGDAGIPNPEMLRCQTFSIERNEHGLLLTYHGVGEEKIRPGAYRGLHSAWSDKKLTSNYESTSRKVRRTLEVQRDGSLLMSVTINPRKGKTRRFKRVFDRSG